MKRIIPLLFIPAALLAVACAPPPITKPPVKPPAAYVATITAQFPNDEAAKYTFAYGTLKNPTSTTTTYTVIFGRHGAAFPISTCQSWCSRTMTVAPGQTAGVQHSHSLRQQRLAGADQQGRHDGGTSDVDPNRGVWSRSVTTSASRTQRATTAPRSTPPRSRTAGPRSGLTRSRSACCCRTVRLTPSTRSRTTATSSLRASPRPPRRRSTRFSTSAIR